MGKRGGYIKQYSIFVLPLPPCMISAKNTWFATQSIWKLGDNYNCCIPPSGWMRGGGGERGETVGMKGGGSDETEYEGGGGG